MDETTAAAIGRLAFLIEALNGQVDVQRIVIAHLLAAAPTEARNAALHALGEHLAECRKRDTSQAYKEAVQAETGRYRAGP